MKAGFLPRLAVCCAVVAVLAGCAVPREQFRTVYLMAKFDADEIRRGLEPGPLSLSGAAFLRQKGGGVVTCAGATVFLTPVTAYTKERMLAIYGSSGTTKFASVNERRVRFIPDDVVELEAVARKERCDAQGNFQFSGLRPGSYYVSTVVLWSVGYNHQGGAVMERVDLESGKSPRVVLSGD